MQAPFMKIELNNIHEEIKIVTIFIDPSIERYT